MPTVFNSKDSIFFVGGITSKVGDANAGGATLEAWLDPAKLNKTLQNVMKSDGSCRADETTKPITSNGSGKIRITADADDFEDCLVGQVAYLYNAAPYATGRYEVIDTNEDDWIDLDVAWAADVNGDVKVGGAFDTLQSAIDNTDANAATPHNVDILDNKGKTYSGAGDQIDIDTGGGNVTSNTWKQIIGIDNLGVELAKGSYVTFDGNNQACHVFTFNTDHIRFKHIYAKDADSTHDGFYFLPSTQYYGFVFEDCKSTGCRYGIYTASGNVRDVFVKGGYYEADSYAIYEFICYGLTVIGAVLETFNAIPPIRSCYYITTIIDGCLIKCNGVADAIYGSTHIGNPVFVRNCVLYDVLNGLYITTDSRFLQYNNICIVHAKATGKFINNAGGGVDYSDYSCLWAMDGAPAAADRWGGTGLPENSIEEDPQFVDAANGDFRLKPKSPLINKGFRPLGSPSEEGYTTIGAWQRISYLLGMK